MRFSVAALALLKFIGVRGSVMLSLSADASSLSPSPSPSPPAPGEGWRTNDANANAINKHLRKANVNASGAIPSDQRMLEANDYYFTRVGDGICLNSSGKFFSQYSYSGAGVASACAQQCRNSCTGTGAYEYFRGFVFNASDCYCLVDSPTPDPEICFGGSYFSNPGTGEIVGTLNVANFECWKVADPEKPSSQPSSSSEPSSMPSSQPSSDPSQQPSSEPSSDPSSEPSSEPSSDPSSEPSWDPSEQPSSDPSESPSSEPSSDPSEEPSWDPSEQPSSEPSSDPSSEPSSMPSCSPSSSPTESPSTKYGTNMFYPIWERNYNGCRNDGLEPNYMAANPTDWLSSTNEACCSKFFNGFLYDACMGRYPPNHDDCIKALFYPDWSGSNEGCIADGREPYYMLSNFNYFFSNSIEECCEKFYQWNYFDCTGTKPELTNGEYYPDWTGSSTAACLNDDKMPTYMLNDQGWYLSTTLEKCCERHFSWGLRDCLGTADVGTNEWYVNYGDETCVQDCNGASPCGGIADSWVQLFKSKEECCEDTLPWKPRCRFY